ncbi:DUF397 domain-containing protein [Actinomadura sp. 21ATH]|uniref:DUF397 domain-containing protein n=1 Tax=Actinomadura sp. 21ATH TaxID=1735444 RepID=UPI0035BFCBC2
MSPEPNLEAALVWQKSTASQAEACVEAAAVTNGVLIRDSHDPAGPRIRLYKSAWSALLTAIRATHRLQTTRPPSPWHVTRPAPPQERSPTAASAPGGSPQLPKAPACTSARSVKAPAKGDGGASRKGVRRRPGPSGLG